MTIGSFSLFRKQMKTHCKTLVESWFFRFSLILDFSVYFEYLSRITFRGSGNATFMRQMANGSARTGGVGKVKSGGIKHHFNRIMDFSTTAISVGSRTELDFGFSRILDSAVAEYHWDSMPQKLKKKHTGTGYVRLHAATIPLRSSENEWCLWGERRVVSKSVYLCIHTSTSDYLSNYLCVRLSPNPLIQLCVSLSTYTHILTY